VYLAGKGSMLTTQRRIAARKRVAGERPLSRSSFVVLMAKEAAKTRPSMFFWDVGRNRLTILRGLHGRNVFSSYTASSKVAQRVPRSSASTWATTSRRSSRVYRKSGFGD